ncbi:Polysaccharide pyruvyl transferase [Prauserella aidingensis]|uniref:polysaccharide pyruvyl transferase family protein n=1 Tax=Prauserella aidingensis TaxID=387890 RepID=UPI0020A3DB47|nr:polysaccharide pyruvyl transferase family protein [Prauserella aidingensis]MCP2254132.1 Polysaccharide pyruvyl transferase [Prauserella aidingensis]
MRVLLTSWASFARGEATAGDVRAVRAVSDALSESGVCHDTAWSPGFLPGELHVDDAPPSRYSHLVFACGPVHGWQIRELHERYSACRRIAVGVSVPDPNDPAATGFHRVLPRDDAASGGAVSGGAVSGDAASRRAVAAGADLSLAAPCERRPVVGVTLALGQPEYGRAGRHDVVHEALTAWLRRTDVDRVPLDTRLATDDWRHCATPDQFGSVPAAMDAVVSTRLHRLVLGLAAGVPVLAVDPVAGGGKVTAQARVLGWPVVGAGDVHDHAGLSRALEWCLSDGARTRVTEAVRSARACVPTGRLLAEIA